jgi:hypothetical protein
MKMLILAAIAALGLGMASANAATNHQKTSSSQQGGDQFNFMRGGGG